MVRKSDCFDALGKNSFQLRRHPWMTRSIVCSLITALNRKLGGPRCANRERVVAALLSPRSEQVPFTAGALCLGRFQRIMLFSLDAEHRSEWSLTLLG